VAAKSWKRQEPSLLDFAMPLAVAIVSLEHVQPDWF
jgi:hypothetical protein